MINWNGIFCAGVQHDNQTTAGSLDFAWIEEKKEKKKQFLIHAQNGGRIWANK